MSDCIECEILDGRKILIPREKVTHRPSVYGLIAAEGKLLLLKTKTTGKYWPPGGGIDIGETMEVALKREVWEECGIEIDVASQLFFREKFFYYEPHDLATQVYLLFFAGKPKSMALTVHDLHDESTEPSWIDIATLKASDFQGFGEDIMRYLERAELNKEE